MAGAEEMARAGVTATAWAAEPESTMMISAKGAWHMDAIDFTWAPREKSNDDFGYGRGAGRGAGNDFGCGFGNGSRFGAGRYNGCDWGCGGHSSHGHVDGFGYGFGYGSGNGSGWCSGGKY